MRSRIRHVSSARRLAASRNRPLSRGPLCMMVVLVTERRGKQGVGGDASGSVRSTNTNFVQPIGVDFGTLYRGAQMDLFDIIEMEFSSTGQATSFQARRCKQSADRYRGLSETSERPALLAHALNARCLTSPFFLRLRHRRGEIIAARIPIIAMTNPQINQSEPRSLSRWCNSFWAAIIG